MKSKLTSAWKWKVIAEFQTYQNRRQMGRVTSRNKVFCVGLNKTGTTSWAQAMRELGYVVGSETKSTMFYYDWANNEYSHIIEYCHTDGQAFQDIPFSLPGTFRVMDAAFPGSKFVLTVRDSAEQWYNSLIRFHGKHWSTTGRFPPDPDDLAHAVYWVRGFPADYCRDVFKTPISDPYNRDILLKFYRDYNSGISRYFSDRPGDLLILNVAKADAYNQLREFLDLKPRTGSFPWANKN